MRRHAFDAGFTLVELLIAALIVGLLAAAGLVTLLGRDIAAHHAVPQATVQNTFKQAHILYIENGYRYPPTDELLRHLAPEDFGYTYRASLDGTSESIDPFDIAVSVDDDHMITLCARSRRDAVFCTRRDELKSLAMVSDDSDQAFSAWLWGPEDAAAVTDEPVAAYSMGFGDHAEGDALAALPSRQRAGTYNAGPANTGQPHWGRDKDADGQPRSAPLPPPAPVPVPTPPEVQFTATPPQQTLSRDARFAWKVSGGEVHSRSCTLNGDPVSCLADEQTFKQVPRGAHAFAVNVEGPGGADSVVHTWRIEDPPHDRLILDGVGDHAFTASTPRLRPDGAFELSAWVRQDSRPAGDGATIASLGCTWSNGTPCRASDSGWRLWSDGSQAHLTVFVDHKGKNSKVVTDGKAAKCPTGQAPRLDDKRWHYITAAYDPASAIRVYVDGVLQSCSADLKGRVPKVSSTGPLRLGATEDNHGTLRGLLYGAIGELRMTRDGAAAHVTDPGPADQPGVLYPQAENGRPAEMLFSFQGSTVDSSGALAALVLAGDAHLAGADE